MPLTQQNLQYLGAVRTPQEHTDKVSPRAGSLTDGLNYSGTPFCIDFHRKEYVLGSGRNRTVRLQMVRPSYPMYQKTGDTKLLDRASVPLANYVDGVMVDLSNNTWGEINNPDVVDVASQEGFQVLGDRIVVAGSIYYDASATQDRSFFMAEWPITSVRPVNKTPWRSAAKIGEGVIAGPMAMIPEKYRDALRGDVIAGQSGLPIISRQSMGPCAVSFWANDLITTEDFPNTMLVGYIGGESLVGGWSVPANDLFNSSTMINGMAFVGDQLIFVGTHGYGDACYGGGTGNPAEVGPDMCFDPTNGSKGTHCYPYRVQAWIYNVQDLIDVVQGKWLPHQLPVTWFPLEFPFFEHQHYKWPTGTIPKIDTNGVGYDAEACELHLCVRAQDSYGYEPGPLIHVFKVNNVASEPNPKPTVTALPAPGASTPTPVPEPTPDPEPEPEPVPEPTPTPPPSPEPTPAPVPSAVTESLARIETTLAGMIQAQTRLDALREAVRAIDAKVKANQRTVPNWLEAMITDLLKL